MIMRVDRPASSWIPLTIMQAGRCVGDEGLEPPTSSV
jgi:hypothetical protein